MRNGQLKAFDMVAMEGSFSQAAIKLGITQPAVTYQVRTLEQEYDCLLFRRDSTGASLTGEGEALFAITRRLFGAEQEAREYLDATHEISAGTLNIAADAPQFVLDLLEEFLDDYPNIQVNLTSGNSREVLQDLFEKRVDVVVTGNPPSDERLVVTPFHRHGLCVVLPIDHPLADKAEVGLAELSSERFLMRERISTTRQDVEKYMDGVGFLPKTVMELGGREAVKEAVAKGFGVGFMFHREAEGDARIIAKPLAGEVVLSVNSLVCLKAQLNRGVIRQLVKTAEALGRIKGVI